jgi:hypothetical protein
MALPRYTLTREVIITSDEQQQKEHGRDGSPEIPVSVQHLT